MKIFYSLTVCAVMLLAGCAHQATKNPEPATPSPDNDLMIGNRGGNATMNANSATPPTPEQLSQRQMSLNIYEQKLNAYKAQLDSTRDQLAAQAQQLKAREQELSHREAAVKQNTRKKTVAKNTVPANSNNASNNQSQTDAADSTANNSAKTDNSNQALTEILHKLQNGTYGNNTGNGTVSNQ